MRLAAVVLFVVIPPPALAVAVFYRFSRVSNSTIYEGKQMMHLQNCRIAAKYFFKILPLSFLQNDDEIARVLLSTYRHLIQVHVY